jgi:hypothetical protein
VLDEQAADAGAPGIRGHPHALKHGDGRGPHRARRADLPGQMADDLVAVAGQQEQAGLIAIRAE